MESLYDKIKGLAAGIAAAVFLLPLNAFASEEAAGAAKAVADPKAGWHKLWHELLIDITVIGVVFFVVMIYLVFKYRRKNASEEGQGVELSKLAIIGWVLIPAFVFMADDIFLAAKNFELWNTYRRVPSGAYEIKVQASMYSWDAKHPSGINESGEIHVAAGAPVYVRLNSSDVVHSFFIPDYKVKWDTMPGRETYVWFYPDAPGEHVITCAEYCGVFHFRMSAKLIVMPAADFANWVKANKPKEGKV